MLFLMNDVVLNLEGVSVSPKIGSRRFRALSFSSVTDLGRELYAEQPLLHYARPARSRRLAALIVAKAPLINAALFSAPAFGCAPQAVSVRYANIAFEVMAELYVRQKAGELDLLAADRRIWRRLAA